MGKLIAWLLGVVAVTAAASLFVLAASKSANGNKAATSDQVIAFGGRVYAHATGQGVPEVSVVLNLVAKAQADWDDDDPVYCMGGQVVKTNVEGRYDFSWDWRALGLDVPDSVEVRVLVYSPKWEYYPTSLRAEKAWRLLSEGAEIALTKNTAAYRERMQFLSEFKPCMVGPGAETFVPLFEAKHREIWNQVCDPNGEGFDDLSAETFQSFEGAALTAPLLKQEIAAPSRNAGEHHARFVNLARLARQNIPSLPKYSGRSSYPFLRRALTREEKEAVCRDYGPGLNNVWSRPQQVEQPKNFVGAPTIEFNGRVYDHATNQGVSSAFVIVNLETWHDVPMVGHGQISCAGGEVVRTDADGHYQFAWDWQKEYGQGPPKGVSVKITAYAPGWEYYPTTRRIGMTWQYADHDGTDFEMTKDEASIDERLAFLRKVNDNRCDQGPRNASFLPLLEAQHSELWEGVCAPLEVSKGLAGALYDTLEASSVHTRSFASELLRKSASNSERENRKLDLRAVARTTLPEYQRAGPTWDFDFPVVKALDHAQAKRACEALSPERIARWVSP